MGRGGEARPIAEALLAAGAAAHRGADARRRGARRHGRSGRGAQALEQARRLAPLRADVHQRTGDIAASLGDFDGAIAAYRHALELDQDFAVVRYQLARLLRGEGACCARRRQELEGALDAVPTYAEATLELARCAARRGAPTRRSTCSSRCWSAIPTTSTRCSRWPRRCSRSAASATRRTPIRRILRFDPDHVGALYYDGILLTDQKRFREAIERWRRVIELDPSSEFARRARREARTAMDLDTIFSATAAAGV